MNFVIFGAQLLNKCARMRVETLFSENNKPLSFKNKKQNQFFSSRSFLTLLQKIPIFSKKLPIFADVSIW